MPEDYAKKLQSLLRKLFQFESADLDFGIYRIMNLKRDVVEKFIEKDLIASVDTEFGKISATTKESVKKELDALKTAIDKTLGSSALLPSGDFNPQYANTPIGADLAKQYKEKMAAYAAASVSDEHKAEVFNHIYQFFSRYYDNGDFMSMRRYSARQKFAVPYNGEEVMLHWANKDQYYIKTGEYFFNYAFRVGEYTIRFKIVQAETAMNNTKTENRFFILHTGEGNVAYDEKTKELIVLFEYRALTASEKVSIGTRNIQDTLNEQEKIAILTAIPDIGLRTWLTRENDGKTPLAKHLATYAKRNTTDYFIHKDLSGFLMQELDFYIKNEMFDLDDLGMDKEVPIEQYLNRVLVMKAISQKIIAFLAQIEGFQKKLFEKKKLVLSTNYCMTLDKVPAGFYPTIAKNANQIAEWGTLYGIKGNSIDEKFLKAHPFLVLDTKFFSREFKDQLLATIDNLDDVTSGLMIKSENWQALNLLQERYREQVKCVYTDPPYNTGSDEFLYKDNYQHSSWLSMLIDRLFLAKQMMSKDAGLFVHIDEREQHRLKQLIIQVLGEENYLAPFVWIARTGTAVTERRIQVAHEIVESGCKSISDFKVQLIEKKVEKCRYSDEKGPYRREQLRQWGGQHDRREERPTLFFPILTPFGTETYPKRPDGSDGCWRANKENVEKMLAGGDLDFVKDPDKGEITVYRKIREGTVTVSAPSNILDKYGSSATATAELKSFFGEKTFFTAKPSALAARCISVKDSNDEDCVLDFFSGSGTTAHAVLSLNKESQGNRRYILVEMADHFYTVMKPRVQKVMYSSEWKDGHPQNTDGISHIFKYLTLEQYEDTLNNIDFMEGGTVQKTLMDMDGYVLRYMLDFETRESPCRMNITKLERPFEYTLRITKDSELRDETVDLVETFNYLLGLKVKRIRTFAENGTTYRIVHGETLSGQGTTVIWRTSAGLDLKSDKSFIEETVLTDPKFKAERVFINGDFHVEGALPIEPEFQRLMGA